MIDWLIDYLINHNNNDNNINIWFVMIKNIIRGFKLPDTITNGNSPKWTWNPDLHFHLFVISVVSVFCLLHLPLL